MTRDAYSSEVCRHIARHVTTTPSTPHTTPPHCTTHLRLLRVVISRRHVDEHERLRIAAETVGHQLQRNIRPSRDASTTVSSKQHHPYPRPRTVHPHRRHTCVSLLLRYGMNFSPVDKAEMTSPSADSDLLMDCASRNLHGIASIDGNETTSLRHSPSRQRGRHGSAQRVGVQGRCAGRVIVTRV